MIKGSKVAGRTHIYIPARKAPLMGDRPRKL
jgi:hypothetical protein